MHCTSCALNIDGALEDEVTGVISARTRYVKSEMVVEYDPEEVSESEIRMKIEQLGYQVKETGS